MTETAKPAGRDRRIGWALATLLVAGNMIGSGVYLLPASLAAIGSSTIIGWVVAAVGSVILALMFAVLGRLKPSPDGLVAYAAEGLHPAAGFTAWLAYWTAAWVGNAAIALALVGYLGVFFPQIAGPVPVAVAALVATWIMVAANLLGAKLVARFGGLTLIIGLAPILAATVLGFLAFDPAVFAASWNMTGRPLAENVSSSLTIVFWAYIGLECANACAGVVRRPERDVPIAAVGGVVLSTVVYIAASAAVLGVIPAAELARSNAPFADVVGRLAGGAAAGLVAACALAKTFGSLGGWLLVTAETSRSAAEEGLWPRLLSNTPPGRTPVRDVLVAGPMTSLAIVASLSPTLGSQFQRLIEWAVVLSSAVYGLSALALFRWSGEIADPGRRLGARVLAVLSVLFTIALIAAAGRSASIPALLLMAATVPIYFVLTALRRRGVAPA